MANVYKISGLSYTPHENMEWFTRSIYGGRLVQGGYIRVLTDIKGEELLSQIDLENKILQADGKDCAWTPNQLIKLSEQKARVKTYKINAEQCIDELENKRTAYMLSPGAKNDELPDELEAATLYLLAIGLSNEIEQMIIGGDETKDPNDFNGMVKTLLSSPDSIQLQGQTITVANVLELVEEVYDALPEAVLQAEDSGIAYMFVSYATRRKLRRALAKASNQVLYPSFTLEDSDKRNPKVFYEGVELVPVKSTSYTNIDNTIIAMIGTNALLLTDLMSDLENIELGQFPAPHDSKVFMRGRLRLGFAIPFADECVIMSDAITADRMPAGNDDLRIVPSNLIFDVAGESKTFTVITKDTTATVSINATGSGFNATAGTTTGGVTTVTVTASDITGSINPKTGQVLVSIDDTDRSATLMLEQRNDNSNAEVVE